ncbi:MAG: hypothetical protein QME12_05115 [Nanoarchaeota archaeon]|nr:hypothetical protein [Nanoarchaeota archaeon]
MHNIFGYPKMLINFEKESSKRIKEMEKSNKRFDCHFNRILQAL